MKYNISIILILVSSILISCSKKEEKITVLKEKNLETQMIEVYNQGMEEFKKGDVIYAGKNLVKQSFCTLNLFGLQELY